MKDSGECLSLGNSVAVNRVRSELVSMGQCTGENTVEATQFCKNLGTEYSTSSVSHTPNLRPRFMQKLQPFFKPQSEMAEPQAAPGFKTKFHSRLQLPQKSAH